MVQQVPELKTAPYDPRFPNTNQTKHCYHNFLEFQRCAKKKGESFDACQYFKRIYKSMCPNEWVQKWDSEIEEGIFAGRI